MKIKSAICTGVLFLSMGLAQAAEDFSLWSSATFTRAVDFVADGGSWTVATSANISNPSGFDSIQIVLDYENLTPKPCNCQVLAVLEQEIAAGIWTPMAAQHEVVSSDDNAPIRQIVLTPLFQASPGSDMFVAVGDGVRISTTEGIAPDSFRVRLILNDTNSTELLDSITVSGWGRKYNAR